MKKLTNIIVLLLLFSLLVACNSKTEQPALLKRVNDMSNEELISEFQIAHAEYVCNINNHFIFDSGKDLDSNALYLFFVERMDASDPDYIKRKKWHNEKDHKLQIPIEEIKEVLNTYLDEYSFNPEELNGYDKDSDSIIVNTITGWGGGYTAKILSKSLEDNILTLKLEFYCELSIEKQSEKVYKLRIEEDGFKFLSVKES